MFLTFIGAWKNDKWWNKRVLIWRFTLALIKINCGQIGEYSITCSIAYVACVGLFGHLFWNKRSFWQQCQIISCHTRKLSANDRRRTETLMYLSFYQMFSWYVLYYKQLICTHFITMVYKDIRTYKVFKEFCS